MKTSANNNETKKMTLDEEMAMKIATMMLQAATYHESWIDLHPIVTRREGREETNAAIAKALAELLDTDEQEMMKQLEWCNGNNSMEVRMDEEHIKRIRHEYQNAPVYQDAKGRQYIMFEGVRTQDFIYQTIDVARYVDFAPTGKYRNIDTLRKRIQRDSDYETLTMLEETGEIENIDPLTIRHLYH